MQTEKLYGTALEYAGLTGNETVWDLYCGIGTISLFLAQNAKKVYGVEIVPQAIEDARRNAALNNITNAEFFTGKAEEVLPEQYEKNKVYADVIVVDPKKRLRSGLPGYHFKNGTETGGLCQLRLLYAGKRFKISCRWRV